MSSAFEILTPRVLTLSCADSTNNVILEEWSLIALSRKAWLSIIVVRLRATRRHRDRAASYEILRNVARNSRSDGAYCTT